MTKLFCDCCGAESERPITVKFCCHLFEGGGYVEVKTWEPVSGRMIDKDLCAGCYNRVMGAAVEMFNEMQALPPAAKE